jgi:hypothetical protein
MVMEGVFLREPTDIFHILLAHAQRWRMKLGGAEQTLMEPWLVSVRQWLEKMKTKLKDRLPEDVFI